MRAGLVKGLVGLVALGLVLHVVARVLIGLDGALAGAGSAASALIIVALASSVVALGIRLRNVQAHYRARAAAGPNAVAELDQARAERDDAVGAVTLLLMRLIPRDEPEHLGTWLNDQGLVPRWARPVTVAWAQVAHLSRPPSGTTTVEELQEAQSGMDRARELRDFGDLDRSGRARSRRERRKLEEVFG